MILRYFSILLSFLVSAVAASSSAKISYRLFNPDTKSYELKNIVSYGKFKISSNCVGKKSSKSKCLALKATEIKKVNSSSAIPMLGHPAARYCMDRDGLNRILKDDRNKEYDYCVFKDDSMIDSWTLYNHHNP